MYVTLSLTYRGKAFQKGFDVIIANGLNNKQRSYILLKVCLAKRALLCLQLLWQC